MPQAWLLLVTAPVAAIRGSLARPGPKSLSVSVEYVGAAGPAIAEISAGLRQAKAAAVWVRDVDSVRSFAEEQATAKGDFPGPVPIIYDGDDAAAAAAAGAAACVVDAGHDVALDGAARIWRVPDAAAAAMAAERADKDDAYLVDDLELLAALPAGACAVACETAMQPDHGEIEAGRARRDAGAKGVLLRGACVGDDEDLPYMRYVIPELLSKRSSSFAMDGFTGTTNGHFGTPGSGIAPKAWQRSAVAA